MEPVHLRPFSPADADWVISRHGAIYAAEEGFDARFEALVADIVAAFVARHDPVREAGWIAEREDRRVGSIFVVIEDAKTAKLRLVLLEPDQRGTGLAQRMLETAMDFARAAGFTRMRLWTHESHIAAGRLYARNGFRCTQSEVKQSFGQDVVSQIWERDL